MTAGDAADIANTVQSFFTTLSVLHSILPKQHCKNEVYHRIVRSPRLPGLCFRNSKLHAVLHQAPDRRPWRRSRVHIHDRAVRSRRSQRSQHLASEAHISNIRPRPVLVFPLILRRSSKETQADLHHRDADVKNVNNFLDIASVVVSNPTQLEVLATGALNNAKDEPTELGILACIAGLDDASEDAINSAAAGFGNNVIDTLTDISVNGANTSQVQAEIRQINTFRCCTLLPGLDALWLSAAENAGLVGQVALSPPRPNACGSGDIICP